jgi:hypothetical protein
MDNLIELEKYIFINWCSKFKLDQTVLVLFIFWLKAAFLT